ncbi:MAG: hypothetical protein C0412_12120 [Flavobacterium sp.]|nr:hypothetical protein [Flavobacterium sp.]
MDRNSPVISVIMPVYNGAFFLRDAIESILNQGFTDFEFIIINDGSKDDSASIINEYVKKDSRIRFINQEQNSGLIDVLNMGLSLAKGEYIARMDADDISHPKRFDLQCRFLDSHPDIGVVGSNVHFIDSVGRRISNFLNNPRLPQTPNQINWALCFSCCLMHPTIMARRELLINAGGYNKLAKHAEDYDLWVRMTAITKFYNLPQKLLLLRKHETNITVIYIDTTLDNSRQISKNIISSIMNSEIPQEMIDIFWQPNNQHSIPQSQIIELFIKLEECYFKLYDPDQKDQLFIKKDISRRSMDLHLQDNRHQQSLKLLYKFALRIDFIEVLLVLIMNALRYSWRKLTKKIFPSH